MTMRAINGKAVGRRRMSAGEADSCLENRGRELLATIVNDEVAQAMRLGLHDGMGARAKASDPLPPDIADKLDAPRENAKPVRRRRA